MAIKPKFQFVLEYVDDIEAVKRFYTDVFGLEVERDNPTFVQFNHFAIASDEAMNASREPEVYWAVEDAQAAFDDLSQKAKVMMSMREMPFGKVFAIQDPEGQPLYLIEFVRDRPSRVV